MLKKNTKKFIEYKKIDNMYTYYCEEKKDSVKYNIFNNII